MEARLQHFVTAAHQAQRTGGSVKLDGAQSPRVGNKGRVWGRLVRWFRQRVFPKREKAENMRVLNRLEETIRQEYPQLAQDKIHSVLEGTTRLPLAQRILVTARQVADSSLYEPQETLEDEIREAKRLGYISHVIPARLLGKVDSVADLSDEHIEFWAQLTGKTVEEMKRDSVTIAKYFQTAWKGRETTHLLSDKQFHYIVGKYNETMSDLFARFPGLRSIPPPCLIQARPTNKAADGVYSSLYNSISVAGMSDKQWQSTSSKNMTAGWYVPSALGLPGTLAHEYGHHISMRNITKNKETGANSVPDWYPELVRVLERNDVIAPGDLDPASPNASDFSRALKHYPAQSGVGYYATINHLEFAAEVLAWYLHPDYGKDSVPKMPAYLEGWVQDCFPVLKR